MENDAHHQSEVGLLEQSFDEFMTGKVSDFLRCGKECFDGMMGLWETGDEMNDADYRFDQIDFLQTAFRQLLFLIRAEVLTIALNNEQVILLREMMTTDIGDVPSQQRMITLNIAIYLNGLIPIPSSVDAVRSETRQKIV